MPLADMVRDVARARRAEEGTKADLEELRREWEEDNASTIELLEHYKTKRVEAEDALRAAVLAASEEEVADTEGVTVRNVKRIKYEEEHAVAWAMDNDHYTLLKLKVRDFETVAKKLKPDFVTITEERQATIAKDLSGVLG